MIYLFDTNVCIRILKGDSPGINKKITSLSWNDCAIPAIVKYELFYGAYKSQKKDATLTALKDFLSHFSEVSFDDKAAEIAGKIRAELDIKGTPIGPNDILIVSIALSGNFILVTNNTKEFERVPGLTVEDWQ